MDTPVHAEVLRSRPHLRLLGYRALAPAFGLDSVETTPEGKQFGLRWIYTHPIEEYARHNGHADLLREAIDGATGE